MVYDVNVSRVTKVLKVGRTYLTWVQNSVLEGELTRAQYQCLKSDIREVIDEEEDSVLFYTWNTAKYSNREILGVEKGAPSQFV